MIPHELINETLTEWITGLNYQFMAFVVLICYGLKYKKNMKWLIPKLGGPIASKWVVGLIVGFTEVISTFDPTVGGTNWTTFLLLIHSYIIVMIFCDDIVLKLHGWINFMVKKKGPPSDKK